MTRVAAARQKQKVVGICARSWGLRDRRFTGMLGRTGRFGSMGGGRWLHDY
jgi:hypothetical protein